MVSDFWLFCVCLLRWVLLVGVPPAGVWVSLRWLCFGGLDFCVLVSGVGLVAEFVWVCFRWLFLPLFGSDFDCGCVVWYCCLVILGLLWGLILLVFVLDVVWVFRV